MPQKEIHFFSRERHWSRGYEWYESLFDSCPPEAIVGEFSTTYLFDRECAERIHHRYPQAKLLASLRNPADRAYSNYVNDIKAGFVRPGVPFQDALHEHPEYLEQGRYVDQIKNYLRLFPKEQLLILIYEDCLKDPLDFIQNIYRFLNVAPDFEPSMLHKKVNVSTVPRFVQLEKLLISVSGFLHHKGIHHLWWLAKKLGLANYIRTLNVHQSDSGRSGFNASWKKKLSEEFEPEILALEEVLERRLPEWRA